MGKEGKELSNLYLKFLFIFIFGIILFSNFISAVDVTACGYLNSANTVYNLKNNVVSTTTCFTVNATNVTLDLNGYEVVYGNQSSTTLYSGVVTSKNYTTVRNGSVRRGEASATLSQQRYGVYLLTNVWYSVVENINASNNFGGVRLLTGCRYNTITNITANYNYYSGVRASSNCYYNNFTNIIANYNVGNPGDGASLETSCDGNTFTNLTANSNGRYGAYIASLSDDNKFVNVIVNSNNQSGIYLTTTSDRLNLTNITANSNGDYGVYIYGPDSSTNHTLMNIIANDNYRTGVQLTSSASNSVVRNIYADSNGVDGLTITSSSNLIVSNITTYNNIYSGVFLGSVTNVTLNDLIANYNTFGFHMTSLINSTLTNVTANSNALYGVGLDYNSYNDTLTDITANFNNYSGIGISGYALYGGVANGNLTNITISNAIANSNNQSGFFFNSSNCIYNNLSASSNLQRGFYLWNSSSNNFTNLTATSNLDSGFSLNSNSAYNVLNNSRIWNNPYGLYLQSAGQFNRFYNNIFNNTINHYNSTSGVNYFNTTLSASTNIIGGTNSGGNYWGSPDGTGYSDICADSDKNGICDSSYNVNGNYDYYSLAKENIPPAVSLPLYTNLTLTNSGSTLDLNIYVTDILSSISSCVVNANGTNQTFAASGNWCNSTIYLTGLEDGNNRIIVYANDSANNFALNNSYYVKIDNIIPVLEINSPEMKTYTISSIIFNITATDDLGVSLCKYSIDGESNETLTRDGSTNYYNRTDSSVAEGSHNVTFYCTDTAGNLAPSSRYFTINLPEEESGESSGGASIKENTSLIPMEKSISLVWSGITANKEITSAIAVEGIKLTRTTIETNQNISSASITIKTVSKTFNPNLFVGLNSEDIYQGFEVKKSGLTDDNIDKVSFEFKVEKSWLGKKAPSSVTIKRKADNSSEWQMLNTTLLSEDSIYYYFKAISPGFSLFAIYFDENICVPGELFCSGDSLKLCQTDLGSTLVERCEFGCSLGRCLDYWEPDEEESVIKRFSRLAFGTWLNFGTIVFTIIVAIISLSLILVSYITFKYFEKAGYLMNSKKEFEY